VKNRNKLIAIAVGLTVMLSGVTFTHITAATNSENNVSVSSTSNIGNFGDIAISPGGNESEINFTWYSSNSKATPMVQLALKSDVKGTCFPTDKVVTFKGATSIGNNGFTSNKVCCSGLVESTQYVYRLGDGTNWSPMYQYNTYKSSSYSFLFAGDPQIGAGGDIAKDTAGWVDTLTKATNMFANSSFLISLGDQVNNGNELNGGSNEAEYSGYFSPEALKSLPVAAIPGNHETYGPGHNTHFNAPNLSDKYGNFSAAPDTGTDYYFTYGNALYMMLNSNDMNEEEHKQFMQDAIAKNPNVTWKIVVLHHSIYSSADHETDDDIIQRRNDLPPIFDSLGIDVVLNGHDHCYTRSYQMKGGQAIKDQKVDANGNVVDPTGTVYITANSASGSKYYEIRYPGVNNNYEAKKEQLHVPTFSRVNITSDSLRITTYRTDTMTQTDSYSLVKSYAPHIATENVIDEINNLPSADAITINDENNVQKALNDYNALCPDQQKLVSNICKLTADENKINELKAQAQAQTQTQQNTGSQPANPSPQVASASQIAPAKTTNVNTPASTLPKTGEFFDFNLLMALGLVSIIGGASLIIFKHLQKNNKKKIKL
jgi:3',5'-cyclic AMP phosphodiesterase CpdA